MTKVQTDRCAAREKRGKRGNREKRKKIMTLPTDPFARRTLDERLRDAEYLLDFEQEHGTRSDIRAALAAFDKLQKESDDAERLRDAAFTECLEALSV